MIEQPEIGRRLRALRLGCGLTQAEASERTGIHRPNIARVERGAHVPSWPTVARLALAYGVPVSQVLNEATRTEQRPGPPPTTAATPPTAVDRGDRSAARCVMRELRAAGMVSVELEERRDGWRALVAFADGTECLTYGHAELELATRRILEMRRERQAVR